MATFELVIGLLLVAVVLSTAARRLGAPYPAFLALGGALLAFIPGAPRFVLSTDLALALFVAPVLLDAAYDSSPRDLKDNWAPLASLVLVAVGLTTLAVACVAHALEPTLPWAAAVALGAIVAPPDAAAATAVLKQVRLPHRIVTVLEGESLLNDASALLIYRLALAAVVAPLSFATVAPTFLLAVVGSLVAGPALAWLMLRLTSRVTDVSSAIIVQFIGCFGVWILAEQLGLSAVLTMVCFAITVARRPSEATPARLRVPSFTVWETGVFVLNVLAFILIGLQIGPILDALPPGVRSRYLYVAGAVLVTVILVRIAWVMTFNTLVRLRIRRYGFHPPRPMLAPSVRSGLIISWCGMRGIVTLAAALALPAEANGAPFPFRDLIILTAFSVVLGTLVIQGLTLKPLLLLLDLRDDDPVGRELELGRAHALQAALASLDGDDSAAAETVRRDYVRLLQSTLEPTSEQQLDHELRRRALNAARQAVSALRANAAIGDTAYHRLEEDLDHLELSSVAP